MSSPSDYEQRMLTLINAERAKVGAVLLVFNEKLNNAAGAHSQWMIATDTFSHTGAGGSSAGTRMKSAGYVFSGSWTWGENISWCSLRGAADYMDEVEFLHSNLMNSPGHRANILNLNYREIGLGFEVGQYQNWQAAFVTQDFAKSGAVQLPPLPPIKFTAKVQGVDIVLTAANGVYAATLSVSPPAKDVTDYVVAAVNAK